MPRTLVIQLGRLGDVVQTTPLLSEIAAAGDMIDVLALRSSHFALLGFPAVGNIVTIPDSLKPLDDAIACGFPHGEIPSEAHELLADLQLPLYDRIINASHAPLGCWLAGAIPCANPSARYGGVIVDRECLYFGAASAYRVALLQFREQNLFNLVDLIRAIPGVPPQDTQPRLFVDQAADLPFALPAGRKIALNPGASESTRCWPAENFSGLAEALSNAGLVPILVGAPSDRDVCEKVEAAARVAIPNFASRTSIPQMAALLARCDLLVSADTGAAHLASAVGTTVLGLYGAAAWFAETSPYGDNHLVLQTPLNAPMSAISLAAVFAAAMNRLDRLSLSDLRTVLRSEKQLAWETSIESPNSNDLLAGLSYHMIDTDSPAHDEICARSLRQAFATEFLTPLGTVEVDRIELSEGHATRREKSEAESASDSLCRILDRMQTVAKLCAESVGKGTASAETQAAGKDLLAATDKLRALASDPEWRALGPVIHNLDWQLRMLPQQEPASTFRAYAQSYASAVRVLRNANVNEDRKAAEKASVQRESGDLKGLTGKKGKEGGQVPRSVRIKAPARQRGSVSP
jgi:ADP-heptose:LPS heptosyltransferase